MASMSIAQARDNFTDVVNNAIDNHERTVLTRRGKGVVAIVPLFDIELLDMLEDRNDALLVEEAWKDVKINGTKPLEAVLKELDL